MPHANPASDKCQGRTDPGTSRAVNREANGQMYQRDNGCRRADCFRLGGWIEAHRRPMSRGRDGPIVVRWSTFLASVPRRFRTDGIPP